MMTPTKRRLFLFGGIDADERGNSVINGQYLTRQQDWRHKQIPLQAWNDSLKPILSKVTTFNHKGVAAVLCPNRTKELKKGLKWNYSGIKWFGKLDAALMTASSISYEAFKDLYVPQDKIYHPSLRDLVDTGLAEGEQSAVTTTGFVIDSNGGFWYRKGLLGHYNSTTRTIQLTNDRTRRAFLPYLANYEDLKGKVA